MGDSFSVVWELENYITGAVKIEAEFTTESVAVEQASDTETVESSLVLTSEQ